MAVEDAKQCYRAAFSPFDEHIMKELESVPRHSRDDARQRKLASLEAGNVELTRRVEASMETLDTMLKCVPQVMLM